MICWYKTECNNVPGAFYLIWRFTKHNSVHYTYIFNNLVILKLIKSLHYEKHHLTTKVWPLTNMVIFFGCKMNWLFTIWNSEHHVMGIWQKYVTATVRNHKNIQNPHLFDKISDINNKLLTSSKKWTFLYMCGKYCIQGVNIGSSPDP